MLVIPDKLKNFLNKVKDQDIADIVISCEREIKDLRQGNGQALPGSAEKVYLAALENFQRFLLKGKNTNPADDPYFMLYRPVVEKLVTKGQLKKDILENFKK